MNGGSYRGGAGFLLDAGGDDLYEAGPQGVNGGGAGRGAGLLIDTGGTTGMGLEAAGAMAAGTCWERVPPRLAVDDVYSVGPGGVNGGAAGGCIFLKPGNFEPVCDLPVQPGAALLLGGGGHDWYEDREGGTGHDKTVVPKGTAGVQMDLPILQSAPSAVEPTLGSTLREAHP